MKLMQSTLVVLSIFSCTVEENKVDYLPLIPAPDSFSIEHTGKTAFSNQSQILGSHKEATDVGVFLKAYLESAEESGEGNAAISLNLNESPNQSDEGYQLTIDKAGAHITAGTGAGLFYGVQSLIQLIESYEGKVPYMTIEDAPRFGYRGLMLDVGRHMFPVAFIKKYIDLMAHYKFNRFHWHLTEDQGWRIEIKKYPELTVTGAYRSETAVGRVSSKTRHQATYDGVRYGGFYTQEEIREVVAYAAERYITVVPEIEMPGHSLGALSAYPSLGCTGGPYEVAKAWGVFDQVYCAGKEETFVFLQGVIDEVVELFPGEYIHIGGDECPKTQWEKCVHCQKRMKDEGLADEHALQSYFIQRMEKYINSKGKRIIGWDEILEGGLAPNATVMSWRGEEGGIAAANENHDVIMTPVDWCYLDYYQGDPKNEPLAIGNFLPVEKVYGYDPVPSVLPPDKQKHILGAQCNVWTEYIKTPEHCEYMVYPRAIAMSEVLWSPPAGKDYSGFVDRMKTHRSLLDHWQVNYATHIFETDSIQ